MDVTLKRFGEVAITGKKNFQQIFVEFDDLGVKEISVPIDAADEVIDENDSRIQPAIQRYWDKYKEKVKPTKPDIDKIISIQA